MEKEKLEKQKINEEKMENVAGGYTVKANYAKVDDGPPELVETLFVNDDELNMIKEEGLLDSDGNISKKDLVALNLVFPLAKMLGEKRITDGGKNEIKVV